MPRKIVYITQERLDLLANKKKTKEFIFYFPNLEMDIIKHQSKGVIYFSYINHNKQIAVNEFDFQKEILEDTDTDIFVVIINSIELRKFKRFMDREMQDIQGLDIIYLDFPPCKDATPPEDLFLFSGGKTFPYHKKQSRPRKKRLTVSFKVGNEMLN